MLCDGLGEGDAGVVLLDREVDELLDAVPDVLLVVERRRRVEADVRVGGRRLAAPVYVPEAVPCVAARIAVLASPCAFEVDEFCDVLASCDGVDEALLAKVRGCVSGLGASLDDEGDAKAGAKDEPRRRPRRASDEPAEAKNGHG